MRPAIIAIALLCCAGVQTPKPACQTVCGMTATEGDCEALRAFESEVVYRVGAVAPLSPWGMCRAVDGWKIEVHPKYAEDRTGCQIGWQIVPGFCVRGFTFVAAHTIELASADWRPSSLAHEMVHVAELPRTNGKGGHCWSQEMRNTLTEVMGRPETSTPEDDCPEASRP
jgi:hypothetical protein